MSHTMAEHIVAHRYYVGRYRAEASRAHRIGWPQGRREAIEQALWHRSEVRRLRRLVASRAAGMKTA